MNRDVIQVPARQVEEELQRHGVRSEDLVTITIDPVDELMPGRRESRARVVAAGLTDADIDRLIKEAQHEVEPLLK